MVQGVSNRSCQVYYILIESKLKRLLFILILLFIPYKLFSQVNIYVFLVPDCPICKYYLPKLHSLAKTFKNTSCTFHYVVPSTYLGNGEKKEFKKDLRKVLKFSNEFIYLEADSLCKKYNAKITPEVFVENQHGIIIYSGAIDNKYVDLKNYRQATTIYYLKDAIECALENVEPVNKRIEPVGCIITR